MPPAIAVAFVQVVAAMSAEAEPAVLQRLAVLILVHSDGARAVWNPCPEAKTVIKSLAGQVVLVAHWVLVNYFSDRSAASSMTVMIARRSDLWERNPVLVAWGLALASQVAQIEPAARRMQMARLAAVWRRRNVAG